MVIGVLLLFLLLLFVVGVELLEEDLLLFVVKYGFNISLCSVSWVVIVGFFFSVILLLVLLEVLFRMKCIFLNEIVWL